jgi:hypothetical protein
MACWLGVEAGRSADAAALAKSVAPAVPAGLVTATVRAACQFASGKTAAVALFSATSLALTKEVLRTMALKRIAVAAWALLSAGALVLAAGTMRGQEPARNGEQKPAASRIEVPIPKGAVIAPVEERKSPVDPLERDLLTAAQQRLDAQRAYYEQGRITIDRFLAASQELMLVERMLSRTQEEALAAIQRHLNRLREIEMREEAEVKAGRGTAADVAEAHQSRLQAEVLLKKTKMPDKTNPDLSALERRLSEVERKLDLLLQRGESNRSPR